MLQFFLCFLCSPVFAFMHFSIGNLKVYCFYFLPLFCMKGVILKAVYELCMNLGTLVSTTEKYLLY